MSKSILKTFQGSYGIVFDEMVVVETPLDSLSTLVSATVVEVVTEAAGLTSGCCCCDEAAAVATSILILVVRLIFGKGGFDQ